MAVDPCGFCSSTRVAVVIDKRIEASPTPGNKYRKRCLACDKWLTMASTAEFETSDYKHVLPRDADPDADDPTVPADEYDGKVRSALTPEQHAQRRDDSTELVADGGTEDVEQPDEDDEGHKGNSDTSPSTSESSETSEDRDDGDDSDEEHTFECPRCHAVNTGYPEECEGGCGAVYDWSKAETGSE
jgi:phage FluMu protein Com